VHAVRDTPSFIHISEYKVNFHDHSHNADCFSGVLYEVRVMPYMKTTPLPPSAYWRRIGG